MSITKRGKSLNIGHEPFFNSIKHLGENFNTAKPYNLLICAYENCP